MSRKLEVTALEVAERFLGLKEVAGPVSNPQVLAMLRLDESWPEGDEVPWCSALPNYVCFFLGLPRSKSLRARSWLKVGREVRLEDAEPGFDLVILARGSGPQPGKENTTASGHVGFYVGRAGDDLLVLGGNQGNAVSVERFKSIRLLTVQRLWEGA